MKIDLCLVFLRFDILKPAEQQEYCPVGIFFRVNNATTTNVFIKRSDETPCLPIILACPEQAFPSKTMNEGPLEQIEVAPLFKRDYRLGEIFSIDIPDDTKKPDKFLFVTHIAEHKRFVDKRPIYRFKMRWYDTDVSTK